MNRLIILALALLMISCAPDPRKQATADAIRTDAAIRAAAANQSREQEAQIHEMNMQDRKAAQAEWQATMTKVIHWGGVFAQVTIAMWMLGLGVAGVWMMVSTGQAYAKYANLRANLIPLDPRTRQFPLLRYEGKGYITLTNPNDNSVLLLDTRNNADTAKIKAMANVQYAGALAHEARLSHRPGDIAKIEAAQIIDGE